MHDTLRLTIAIECARCHLLLGPERVRELQDYFCKFAHTWSSQLVPEKRLLNRLINPTRPEGRLQWYDYMG